MHQIIFYVDRQGKSSLLDYIAELENSKSKDSRIKLTKIREYVKALSENGTYLPEKYAKHLDGEIWELRPIDTVSCLRDGLTALSFFCIAL